MAHDIKLIRNSSSFKDFLSALLKPLQTLTTSMKSFEEDYKKRARFNGQKIILQAALNDIFGVTSAPYIIIETQPISGESVVFYEPEELTAVYFTEPSENDPVSLYEPSEVVADDYDFIVKIPTSIHTAELERRVKAETNLFKLAGKTFKTQTY